MCLSCDSTYVIRLVLLFLIVSYLSAEKPDTAAYSLTDKTIRTAEFLLDGIIHSRYKKPGWREYIMTDRFEVPPGYVEALPNHPRLITRSQLLSAKQKISREPFARWYAFLKQYAYSNYPSQRLVREKAKKIKALAVLYQFHRNPQSAAEAIRHLSELPEAPEIVNLEGGRPGSGWGDYLQSADAIPDICVAYDLLYDELPVELRSEIKRKTLAVVQQLMDITPVTPANNHVTIFMIATATTALTFDQTGEFLWENNQALYRLSMDYLSKSLALIAPDGGYGEGPGYSQYLLDYLSRFAVYQENCVGNTLFDNPRLERMVNWQLDNYKGSGSFSRFDDSHLLNKFYLPLIIHLTPSGHNWEAALNRLPAQQSYQSGMAEALCVYQKRRIQPVVFHPGFAAAFYPDLGQYIFRDQTPSPEFFLSLLGENERWFADVHEHIDPLSFELSAGGEDFIVDGGYGRSTADKNRSYYISPLSSNGILVDGKGVNPNPVSGDPLSAVLKFAFATENFACAALTHRIGDVDITRYVLYQPRATALMFDLFAGEEAHVYSIRLNHTGYLSQLSDRHLKIQKQAGGLDLFLLHAPADHWYLKRGRGLITGKTITEIETVELLSPKTVSTGRGMLMIPDIKDHHTRVTQLSIVKGNGSGFRCNADDSPFINDILFNGGDTLQTALMKTNARLAWITIDNTNALQSFLLLNATYFKVDGHILSFSEPVTIFLEQRLNRWGGYVYLNRERSPVTMKFRGFPVVPFSIDREPQIQEASKDHHTIYLDQSGQIAWGLGAPAVLIPQSHISETAFLETQLSVKDPRTWRPYERNRFNEIASRELLQAGEQTLHHLSQYMFRDPEMIQTSVNVVQGINQYRYNPLPGDNGIRIPHSYKTEQKIGNQQFTVIEDGDWTNTGMEIRDLHIQTVHNAGLAATFRYINPYDRFTSQHFAVDWQQQYGAGIYSYSSSAQDYINYHAKIRRSRWLFIPDMHIVDDQVRSASVFTRMGATTISLQGNSLSGLPVYRQTIYGSPGGKLTFIFSGNQDRQNRSQEYFLSTASALTARLYQNSNIRVTQTPKWKIEDIGIGIRQWGKRINWRQSLQYFYSRWNYDGNISWRKDRTTWRANAMISHFERAENRQFMLFRRYGSGKGREYETRVTYSPVSPFEAFLWKINQHYYYPVTDDIHTSFMGGAGHDGHWQFNHLGGGILLLYPAPIELQLVKYIKPHSSLYQLVSSGRIKLMNHTAIRWQGDTWWKNKQIHYAWIRIMPHKDGWQPGMWIYYRRPDTVRLEGSIVIRW